MTFILLTTMYLNKLKICMVWRGESVHGEMDVLLKDRSLGEDLYGLLGVQSVTGVARRDRVRWFLEHKSDDWVLGLQNYRGGWSEL